MKDIFNIILIIIILIIIYYLRQKNQNNPVNKNENKCVENLFDLDTKYIEFDYNLRPIEKEFIKEQNEGSNMYSWYPNTWIERIDENGNPIYNSRDKMLQQSSNDSSGIPKTSFSYDFNNVKTKNISSILKPEDSQGKTIKEIYDNSIVDYKSLGPKKNKVTDETSDIIMPGGSNLQYYTADTWTYENENQVNGGVIFNNVYGDDPMSNTVSVF